MSIILLELDDAGSSLELLTAVSLELLISGSSSLRKADEGSSQAFNVNIEESPNAAIIAVWEMRFFCSLFKTFFFSIFMFTPSSRKFYTLSNISYVDTMLATIPRSSSRHMMT